jgi:hypothetical protein
MATTHRNPPKRVKRGRNAGGIWEFYRDSDGRWRWQRIDGDLGIVSLSAHGYRHFVECLASAQAEGYTAESEFRVFSWPA